jgi:hypothetical protein
MVGVPLAGTLGCGRDAALPTRAGVRYVPLAGTWGAEGTQQSRKVVPYSHHIS